MAVVMVVVASFNAVCCAAYIGLLSAGSDSSWYVGAAVFHGLLFLVNLVQIAVTER